MSVPRSTPRHSDAPLRHDSSKELSLTKTITSLAKEHQTTLSKNPKLKKQLALLQDRNEEIPDELKAAIAEVLASLCRSNEREIGTLSRHA